MNRCGLASTSSDSKFSKIENHYLLRLQRSNISLGIARSNPRSARVPSTRQPQIRSQFGHFVTLRRQHSSIPLATVLLLQGYQPTYSKSTSKFRHFTSLRRQHSNTLLATMLLLQGYLTTSADEQFQIPVLCYSLATAQQHMIPQLSSLTMAPSIKTPSHRRPRHAASLHAYSHPTEEQNDSPCVASESTPIINHNLAAPPILCYRPTSIYGSKPAISETLNAAHQQPVTRLPAKSISGHSSASINNHIPKKRPIHTTTTIHHLLKSALSALCSEPKQQHTIRASRETWKIKRGTHPTTSRHFSGIGITGSRLTTAERGTS